MGSEMSIRDRLRVTPGSVCVCVWVCVCVHVSVHMNSGTLGNQKRVSDPLGLELQVILVTTLSPLQE